MAVKIKETTTADGRKFEKMLEDLGSLEVRVGIQQEESSGDGVDLLDRAMFNELGLLKNEFGEVADFARRIQGKGEPVEWIPCRYTFR